MKSHPFYLLSIALIIILGFAIYAVNLNNELFWDDTDWIVNNPRIHDFSFENAKHWFSENVLAGIGMRSNYYRPILFSTFAINYELHGIRPFGYHLVNNALHSANAILLFFLILWGVRKRAVALIVALLFLVHPLQTEAVTYVAGRGDPLNVFFMLLALVIFTRMERGSSTRPMGYALSCGALALALLSRETAIIFPFLALVYYVAFLHAGAIIHGLKQSILKTLPYFGMVAIYGILRLTVLNFDNTLNFYATANPYTESLAIRMYTFMGILATYAKLLIAPVGLHMDRTAQVLSDPWHILVVVPFIVLIGLGFLLRYFYKKGRGSAGVTHFGIWLFAVGWFFINLGPTSGITPINALVYEHWLYLALVGPALLVAWYGVMAWERWPNSRIRYGLIMVLIAVIAIFSVLTIRRNIVWGNPITFFQDIVEHYEPDSTRINNNLGNLFYNKGNMDKAAEYYQKATMRDDGFPQPYYNLGSILYARGKVQEARLLFEKAAEVDPSFLFAHQGLAAIALGEKDYDKAYDILEEVIRLNPQDPRGYIYLANVEVMRKDMPAAQALLQKALLMSEGDPAMIQEILRIVEFIKAQE